PVFSRLRLDDVDALALTVERDHAVLEREQGVVLATTHVATGVEACPALPDDDAAGPDRLPAVHLDAQTLTVRFATVPTRTLTFLMCHISSSSQLPAISSRSRGGLLNAPTLPTPFLAPLGSFNGEPR